MLKYQVKSTSSSPRSASSGSSPTSFSSMSMTSLLIDDTLLAIPTTSRSNSLLSLNSTDSSLSDSSEVGILRVDTRTVKQCTDYKTIRVTSATTCKNVIEKFMSTLKLSCRDPNLFEIWMELTTRSGGAPITTLLKLDDESRPYELQRCHPTGMSKFILLQNPAGYLVRVHDQACAETENAFSDFPTFWENFGKNTSRKIFHMKISENFWSEKFSD
ncbi:unnamed protein product [Caenorhabditis angaria]|uniref:Ras-associating domain-containing protein n=1 Tax=Caenorhabditis angaria TaxID=860376 RepID=A0A9P1IVA7_9PELO|nr:unnamed protein product [Caenorhabditis angaria]